MPDFYIEGMIGAPMWPDEPHCTPAMVRDFLASADGADVTVEVNSAGGIATDGLAIYHTLRDYPGRVVVVVTGVAASAASLVAMAGDEIVMRAGAMMMVHDPAALFVEGRGTEDEHRAMADFLAKMSGGYAAIYAARAGIGTDAAREIMRAETWFDAAQAVAAGFADRVADQMAEQATAFAWSIYQHAPAQLRAASRAGGPSKRAVMAAMVGGLPDKPKGPKMAKKTDDDLPEGDDTAPAAQDDTLPDGDGTATSAQADALTAAIDGDDEIDGDEPDGDETDDDENPATAEAAAICDLVMMHNGTAREAGEFIARGVGLSGVVAHYRQKGSNVPNPTPGPRASVTRDERDTRRAGMTAALVAQFTRRDPTDGRARQFMDMTLAQMAAFGTRAPLRTAHDRQAVFMNLHSTSDFPIALDSALNKALADRYADAPSVYREIAREKSFRDFRPHSIIRSGDFPMLQGVSESGEIKSGTIGESAESVTLVPYAVRFDVTRQTLINDDVGAIADAIADQGRMIARFEEATFFALCFGASGNGPTLSNTRTLFNATDKTKAASGAAISIATIGAGRAAIRKHTSTGGANLNLAPRILLVSPDAETAAEQVVHPLVPADADKANPFAGKLTVLSTAELSGNAWYLLTDPRDASQFVYGFLEGASAPRLRMEDIFGRQGMSWSLEHDFAAGGSGRAGAWMNPGA